MQLNDWTQHLRAIYDKALASYRGGNRDLATYFTEEETAYLRSIGLRPINIYDYAEDFASSGEPDWDTALLMIAVRRDYFLYMQASEWTDAEIDESDLPPKDAEMEGIPWLPRIIRKARCFLYGNLCHDIMYCCGGDRRFLRDHDIYPADFLRFVWSAKDDDQKILEFVKSKQP